MSDAVAAAAWEPQGDPLIAERRGQLRQDAVYLERIQRVREDAAQGVLPPLITVDYLVGKGQSDS